MSLQENIIAKLDSNNKVVADWRMFWTWWSVRWSLAGFFTQVAQASALAFMVWQFHGSSRFHWLEVCITITTVLTFVTTFASLYSRLRNQTPVDGD